MATPASIHIGTCGWAYESWRTGFYRNVPRRLWLTHCARRFTGIEIDATFYRLQRRETLARWYAATPEGFRFALKAHRYTTHVRRLRDPAPSIRRDRERALALGGKLAAVLWQLPANLACDVDRLEAFAAKLVELWPETRHALEFRHPSWFRAEVATLLEHHRLANTISDAADWPRWDAITTDLVYVRLHGRPLTYVSRYPDSSLRAWADRVHEWHAQGCTVHVYFDNDAEGHAPYDALRLLELVRLGRG